MKNKIVLLCLIILIVCFSGLAFYFWYHYFLDLGSDGKLSGLNGSKEAIVLTDENKVYATYEEGVDIPINVESYKFKVQNIGVKTARYNLLFVEVSPSQVKDGCTNKTLLKKEELNYQLLLGEKIISQGKLTELQNNILDSRNINIDTSNSYELKVWLNSTSSDNEGKHYHYKVDIEVSEK